MRSKNYKKALLLLLFCGCFMGMKHFCHKQTRGFQLSKIRSDLPYAQERDLLNSEEDTQLALSLLKQKYRLFDKGCQAFAFISEDGTTILKLFKYYHMDPHHWVHKVYSFKPLERLKPVRYRNPLERRERFFNSCILAHQELKEETGLIFSHLVKTSHLNQTITLIDDLHIEHPIQADQVEFVLQKKGIKSYPYFETLCREHQHDRGKKAIDSLISLIETKITKHIHDRDPILKSNIAFIDDRAIEIDIGPFSDGVDQCNLDRELLELSTFQSWLKTQDPVLSDYLESQIVRISSER